jgi:hypothetical protein
MPAEGHAGALEIDFTSDDRAALLAWRDDPRASRAVISGVLGQRRFHFDPLLPALSVVGPEERALSLRLLWSDALPAYDADDISLSEAVVALRGGPWPAPAVALRRLATTAGLPPASVWDAHREALAHPLYGVRMFAAYALSGVVPGTVYPPDVARIVSAFPEPLAATSIGEASRPPAFDAGRGRRNVRQALLWSAGQLGFAARGGHHPWSAGAHRTLGEAVAAQARAWSSGDEVAALERAVGMLHGRPSLGDPGLRLLDVLRAEVHRHRLLVRMGELARDRFYWLGFSVLGVVDAADPAASVVYGPTPEVAVPDSLPPAAIGHNPSGLRF